MLVPIGAVGNLSEAHSIVDALTYSHGGTHSFSWTNARGKEEFGIEMKRIDDKPPSTLEVYGFRLMVEGMIALLLIS